MIDFFDRSIVGDYIEAFVIHVQNEILALDNDVRVREINEKQGSTMTAKPIKPISPLEIGVELVEEEGGQKRHTLPLL